MMQFSGEEFVEHMRARDYESIIRLRLGFENEIIGTRNGAEFRHMSIAYLRLGEIAQAISHYEKLIDAREQRWRFDYDYCELSAAYWVQGDTEESIRNVRLALKCAYGDGARNMTPALQLYAYAVLLSCDKLKAEAVDQIQRKLRTGWAKNWPAPLGRYLLNLEVEEHVVAAIDTDHPLRQPDEWCRFDFYRGIKRIELGRLGDARSLFRSAVDRPYQVTNSTEFVLARHCTQELDGR